MALAQKADNLIGSTMDLLITIFLRIPIVVYLLALGMSKIPLEGRVWDIISVIILALVVVGTFLYFHPIHKRKKKDPMKSLSPEEIRKIKKVQLFNIPNINQQYEAYGMIESKDTDKEQAKLKLQAEALKLGANAVINVTTNIDNNVTGSVGSVATMPRMVSGKTSTVTTYHYEGTAVKLI